MVVVVADDAVDDAVVGEYRKHAAADDAGDAVVAGVERGEGLPAGCDVVVDAVGDAVVGCTVADDDMEGFVLC